MLDSIAVSVFVELFFFTSTIVNQRQAGLSWFCGWNGARAVCSGFLEIVVFPKILVLVLCRICLWSDSYWQERSTWLAVHPLPFKKLASEWSVTFCYGWKIQTVFCWLFAFKQWAQFATGTKWMFPVLNFYIISKAADWCTLGSVEGLVSSGNNQWSSRLFRQQETWLLRWFSSSLWQTVSNNLTISQLKQ